MQNSFLSYVPTRSILPSRSSYEPQPGRRDGRRPRQHSCQAEGRHPEGWRCIHHRGMCSVRYGRHAPSLHHLQPERLRGGGKPAGNTGDVFIYVVPRSPSLHGAHTALPGIPIVYIRHSVERARQLLRSWRVFALKVPFITKEPLGREALFECRSNYLTIFVTTPAPTVLPPSRIAKLRPCSIAIGARSLTLKVTVSPGITSSLSAGSSTSPVTSVVRK